jgi:hypothetical protein
MVARRNRAVFAALGALLGGVFVFVHGARPSAFGQAGLLALAGMTFAHMRELRELGKIDHRTHATRTAWFHFATTNLVAVAYAWFMFDGYATGVAAESAFKAFGSASKDWMLGTSVVGGTLALFRSATNNSASLAALRQNDELHQEVLSLRRMLGDTATLTSMSLDASQAATVDEVTRAVERMVTIASDLPEKSESVDAFTVWIRDDTRWRVLTGRGVSAETVTSFTQPVLASETRGQGLLANLAATGGAHLVIAADASKHAWYAKDPHSRRVTESFAGVLLRDKAGQPIGALCLTSQDPGALPSPQSPKELRRFEKVLQLWAATFSLPVQRYYELIEAE